jgi:PAS domain-containing protein
MDMTRDVGAYAARLLGAIGHPLLILDRKLRVVWTNDALLSTLQLNSEETVGSTLASLGTQDFADPGLRDRLEDVFASASLFRGYEMRLRTPDGGEHTARVGASLIPASTDVPLALLSIEPTGQASSGEAS